MQITMLERVDKKTWTREICEMMAKYTHLYADVSHHGVTKDADIPKYKTAFRGMCNDFPGVIQTKTLFGIDWHVITRADNYEQFKDRYVSVLGDEDIFTKEQIEGFLGGNALHFLGLLPLGTDVSVRSPDMKQMWTLGHSPHQTAAATVPFCHLSF